MKQAVLLNIVLHHQKSSNIDSSCVQMPIRRSDVLMHQQWELAFVLNSKHIGWVIFDLGAIQFEKVALALVVLLVGWWHAVGPFRGRRRGRAVSAWWTEMGGWIW
jgi:hypothetical protein